MAGDNLGDPRAQSFACVLTFTLKLLEDQQQSAAKLKKCAKQGKRRPKRKRSKHDPRREDPTTVSEAAFAKVRQRMPVTFWIELINCLEAKGSNNSTATCTISAAFGVLAIGRHAKSICRKAKSANTSESKDKRCLARHVFGRAEVFAQLLAFRQSIRVPSMASTRKPRK